MIARALRELGLATALTLAFGSVPARAAPAPSGSVPALSAVDRQQLAGGARVERPLELSGPGGAHYVGGISYQIVASSPECVLAALLDVERLPAMLPRTRSAELVSADARFVRIQLEQGQSPFVARYTIVVERPGEGDELRFWMDPKGPHGVRDVFGFFRAQPWSHGRTLVTVAAAVDLGSGLFSGLLEGRVQALVLRSVTGIRDFLEPDRVAALGYPGR